MGSNSSLPAYGRHHTSQYLNIDKYHFLIDCGEGTQYQMLEHNVSLAKFDRAFISHLHGDHYLGLMGILFSMHLSGRTRPFTVYGQRGLDDIILTNLRHSSGNLNYPLDFIELDPDISRIIYENNTLTVESFPLSHRIPCCGFIFREKVKSRRIKAKSIPENFDIKNFELLKAGKDILDSAGNIIYKNEHLTLPPKRSRSYAFCSDTGFKEDIIPVLNKVNMMYHETTFLEEKEIWARETFHSTTKDAGIIAREAEVEKLLIGHFSARYKNIDIFVEETRKYFPHTEPAVEGEVYTIKE